MDKLHEYDSETAMKPLKRRPTACLGLLSAFPEMSAAANAILMRTDEILVKPMNVPDLLHAITQRLTKGPLNKRKVETLAAILERTAETGITARSSMPNC